MPYAYSRPYVYSFWQIFQALRLFPALRLFQTLEYIIENLDFWWSNPQKRSRSFPIFVPFLSEAVEASLCYFFENLLMKLKFFILRSIQIPSKENLTSIFLSVRCNLKETFQCVTPCTSHSEDGHEKSIIGHGCTHCLQAHSDQYQHFWTYKE